MAMKVKTRNNANKFPTDPRVNSSSLSSSPPPPTQISRYLNNLLESVAGWPEEGILSLYVRLEMSAIQSH